MNLGVRAAVDIGGRFGLVVEEPVLLQETNNTVVWLRPEAVVAKVATRADAQADLRLEHAVAAELAAVGAEIAAPLPDALPTTHEESGFVVTLWEKVDGISRSEVAPADLARSLRRLHAALAQTQLQLPHFLAGLKRARRALDDDSFLSALEPADRLLLRDLCDQGLADLEARTFEQVRLHGEPHEGNRVVTADGIRWLDFESCCIGPLEWDLASQSPEVVPFYDGVDTDLLRLLRLLNSVRIATWCWGQARFPAMRRHGESQLAMLRNSPIAP